MTAGTIIVLASSTAEDSAWAASLGAELSANLQLAGTVAVHVLEPVADDASIADERTALAHAVAHASIELTRVGPVQPLVLVARGSSAAWLPALGFAQRASRRSVSGYVCIDSLAPRSGTHDWPDAPVTLVCSGDDPGLVDLRDQARLRGWDSVDANSGQASVVASLALAYLGHG